MKDDEFDRHDQKKQTLTNCLIAKTGCYSLHEFENKSQTNG